MNPTDQRLAIIPRIVENDLSLFDGVLLTGSMVFGKYHSVHAASDIDLIFVINPAKTGQLKHNPLFEHIAFSDDFTAAFSEGHIDRFWLDTVMDGIKLNLGIWDSNFLDDFIALRAEFHRLGTRNPSVHDIEAVDPYGKPYTYKPKIEQYKSIYVKKFPLMFGSTPISSPAYNNLIASEILYDPGATWAGKIESLIRGLNQRYDDVWVDRFLEYILRKSSDEYLAQLRKRIAAEG